MTKEVFNEKDLTRISVIFMFLIATGFMNYIVGVWFETGGMIVSLIIIALAMIFSYKTMVKVKFPAEVIAFCLVVTLYYVITSEVSVSTIMGREFVFYFGAVSVISMYKCNTEKFLRYSSVASLVILFFYNDIYVEMTSSIYNTEISMGLSYALLPLLMAPMFHFFFFRKERKQFFMYIVYIIAAFLLVQLCLKGTRGVVLTVVFSLCMIYVKGTDKKRYGKFSVARAVVVSIIVVLGIIYFYDILSIVKTLFDSWGIEGNFLEKIIRLGKEGDISNGRSALLTYTVQEFLKAPLFGHGIGTMYYNSYGMDSYAHNFVLQLLYDGGIILAIPVLIVIGRAIYYVFRGEDENETLFTLYMVCVTLPKACFTGDVWENTLFWLFVVHSMAHHRIKRKIGYPGSLTPPVLSEEEMKIEGNGKKS